MKVSPALVLCVGIPAGLIGGYMEDEMAGLMTWAFVTIAALAYWVGDLQKEVSYLRSRLDKDDP